MLLLVHGLFRWVVVILGVVTLAMLANGLIKKTEFTKLDRQLSMFFGIAMDIQVLLGILNLLTQGLSLVVIEHAFIMILALVAVHLSAAWRKAPDAVRFRNTLISYAVALVFIFIGVSLVNGWVKIA